MALNAYRIKGFRGGIADDAYKGVAGAFRFGYGLDIRNGADTLKCNQALEKDSGSVVTDLILFFVPASNGKLYGFGNAGNIYSKDTPAWARLSTPTTTDQEVTCRISTGLPKQSSSAFLSPVRSLAAWKHSAH